MLSSFGDAFLRNGYWRSASLIIAVFRSEIRLRPYRVRTRVLGTLLPGNPHPPAARRSVPEQAVEIKKTTVELIDKCAVPELPKEIRADAQQAGRINSKESEKTPSLRQC